MIIAWTGVGLWLTHVQGSSMKCAHYICHDRDRTYPYTPYPDLSTPIPSHLNHSRAPNAKPEPSDPLASQQHTPEHPDSLVSSQHIPDPTLLRSFPLPRIKSTPDIYTHSRPDAPSTFPLPRVKSIPDNHTHS